MKTTIHIGQHKTGTTSIQHYLRDHRKELAARGCYVPKKIMEFTAPSHFILNVWALDEQRSSSMKKRLLKEKPAAFWETLEENLHLSIEQNYQKAIDQKCDEVIWTNEGLYLLNSAREHARLYKLFERYSKTIKVVCCFRDKKSYQKSYKTQLKKNKIELSANWNSCRYLEDDSWLFDYDRKKVILEHVFDETTYFDYCPKDNVKNFMKNIGRPISNINKQYRLNT